MLSKELQLLIEASLTDGVLTDKEREVIRKRALLEGQDPDEVDILLEAEIQKLQQKQETRTVKKCPRCGEAIPSMAVKCAACGYEFQEQEANKIVEQFTKGRMKCKETFWKGNREECRFIENFVIPNNAEDLLEMIIYLTSAIEATEDDALQTALKQKYKECTEKAKLLYANDSRFVNVLKSTKLSWWKRQSSVVKVIICFAGVAGLWILLSVFVFNIGSDRKATDTVEKVETTKQETVDDTITEPKSANITPEPTSTEKENEANTEETEVEETSEAASEQVDEIDAENAVDEAKEKTKSVFNKLKKKAAEKVKKAAEKVDSKLNDE